MATLPSPIRWAAGQVVTAADRNAHINAVLNGLAGRSGTIELEDSLAILDGSGNRYIRLPASTASAGERAQMRYDATNGRLQYHDGSSWQTVWATTAVDLFAALLAGGDVGPGSEQVARGNHTHGGAPAPPFVPDLVLGIDDFDQTGLDTPIVLALLTATISGNDFTAEGVVPDEGSLVVNDLTIDHMERHSNGASIRLRGSEAPASSARTSARSVYRHTRTRNCTSRCSSPAPTLSCHSPSELPAAATPTGLSTRPRRPPLLTASLLATSS